MMEKEGEKSRNHTTGKGDGATAARAQSSRTSAFGNPKQSTHCRGFVSSTGPMRTSLSQFSRQLQTRKGFVFTTDSIVALLFASMFISMIYSGLASMPIGEDVYKSTSLHDYSLDLLIVLEKGGYLAQVADKNIRGTQLTLSRTPDNYCFYVRITDEDGKRSATIRKPKCGSSREMDVFTRRMFVHNGKIYMAELGAWHKLKGEDDDD